MSVPSVVPRGDAMSVSVIRGLLERNLVERAVALSETRWHGSGPLVRLAYEWAGLSPAERRDRLAAIGPEDLARLRGVAELQPDLARVLDDLERRGVIPPAGVVDPSAATPMTPEEAVVDAVLDVAEERTVELAGQANVELPPVIDDLRDRLDTMRERADADLEEIADEGKVATQAFLAAEAERRSEAAERGVEMLDRIRRRVDGVSSRVSASEAVAGTTAPVSAGASPTIAPVVESPAEPQVPSMETIARSDLTNAILSERVYEPDPEGMRPSDDEFRAVALSMGLNFVRIDSRRYGNREIYGGLVRKGRGIVEEAGFLPRALAGRSLVVFSGRVYPSALARIDDGYFDIPGTRVATRVHPDSRLIVLPG